MAPKVRELLDLALDLSPAERARLAREIIASIETGLAEAEDPPEVAVAWRDEIAERLRDVDEGRVKLIPSKTVHEKVRRDLVRARSKRRK